MKRQPKRIQTGFSLIEVSVALAIYSLGISGLALLLLVSLQNTVSAETRSLATTHAASYADLNWMHGDAPGHAVYPPQPDIENWQHHIEHSLPEGLGIVCPVHSQNWRCADTSEPTVSIRWQGETGMEFFTIPLP